MSVGKQVFPVTKNGVFFGYADADQIAAKPELALYDEAKAAGIRAALLVEAAKEDAENKAALATVAAAGGSDPSAVKKAPAK